MSGAHQKLEHAEHAAHAEHHSPADGGGHEGGGSRQNRIFGITMALIGVLIAFCSLMVGSERNELTKAMIKQTQAHADWTAASTKVRIVMIELEKQHARIVAARDPQGGWSPVSRFIQLASDYNNERKLAKIWSDSYEPVVEGHFDAAEGYEHAQLIAEIGIVLASLAVLLASRPAWVLSIFMSVLCMAQLGRTYVHTTHVVDAALVHVVKAEEEYDSLRKSHGGGNEDEKAIERLDPDGSIRADLAAKAKERESGAPQKTAKKE